MYSQTPENVYLNTVNFPRSASKNSFQINFTLVTVNGFQMFNIYNKFYYNVHSNH